MENQTASRATIRQSEYRPGRLRCGCAVRVLQPMKELYREDVGELLQCEVLIIGRGCLGCQSDWLAPTHSSYSDQQVTRSWKHTCAKDHGASPRALDLFLFRSSIQSCTCRLVIAMHSGPDEYSIFTIRGSGQLLSPVPLRGLALKQPGGWVWKDCHGNGRMAE